MDLRALRYFLTVVKAGSFLAASRSLRLSQPALGHQIKKLEDTIGAELLVRHSRGIRPTEAGQELVVHAERIFALVRRAEEEMQSFRKTIVGTLNIGVTPSVGEMLVPRFLELCAARPRMSISLRQGHSSDLFADVTAGKLGAAFCFDPPRAAGVRRLPLYRESLYLVGPATVVGDTSEDIPFRQLTDFPLLLDSRSQVFRQCVEAAAAREKLSLNISAEIDDVFLKKGLMTRHGTAVILIYSTLQEGLRSGLLRARRIKDPTLNVSMNLVVRNDTPDSIKTFLRSVVAQIVQENLENPNLRWQALK